MIAAAAAPPVDLNGGVSNFPGGSAVTAVNVAAENQS